MPYIAFSTSLELSLPQKEKLKSEFGRLIPLIPGKAEADLQVDISSGRVMYMAGTEESSAFVELRILNKADMEAKKRFTQETFAMLHRELQLSKDRIYLNIIEFEHWGYGGDLH
ncbi:MAG: hypothetical protein LBC57_06210 [Treponema sp.]|nr:hypothetical protein [Treponema sp.]